MVVMKRSVIIRRKGLYIEYYIGNGCWSRNRADAREYTESERKLMESTIQHEGGREEPA